MKLSSVCLTGLCGILLLCSCRSTAAVKSSSALPPAKPQAKQSAPPLPEVLPEAEGERSANYKRALLLVQTMEMLRKNYVDGAKVSYEELFNHAMRGMVSALDPYSGYEVPREHSTQQIRRKGSVVGIGATAVKPDGKPVTVIRVLPGTPAETAGVRPGDQIMAIDGVNIIPLNLTSALEKLRGAPDTQVKLQIRRGQREFPVTVTRKVVRTSSVVPGSVKLISGKTGYIKLTGFSANSAQEVKEALKKLHALGCTGIILDLRYNPGGLVRAAVDIASLFMPEGKVVFQAKSRNKSAFQQVKTRKSSFCDTKTPLIILTNAFSASASEILTGALQDHKRAKVLGKRTFGKGTILSVVPVTGGGAVRFASAFYVTPGGRVIEKKGIMPDVEVTVTSAEVMRLSSQTLRYPGAIAPPVKGAFKDRQLERAVRAIEQLKALEK